MCLTPVLLLCRVYKLDCYAFGSVDYTAIRMLMIFIAFIALNVAYQVLKCKCHYHFCDIVWTIFIYWMLQIDVLNKTCVVLECSSITYCGVGGNGRLDEAVISPRHLYLGTNNMYVFISNDKDVGLPPMKGVTVGCYTKRGSYDWEVPGGVRVLGYWREYRSGRGCGQCGD